MSERSFADRLQGLIAWGTLICVLASALALGANRPISWSLLALAVTAFFALQMVADMRPAASAKPVPIAGLAGLYLGCMIWLVIQTIPGIWPDLAHPLWQIAPEHPNGPAPAISATPGAGRQHLLRLLTYGMVFWIALRSAQDRGRVRSMLLAIAVFSTALALFGIYAFATGHNPILGEARNETALSASFVNRNAYATFAIFGILTNLALFSKQMAMLSSGSSKSTLRDGLEVFFSGAWVHVLGVIACTGALALTQSRAGAAAGLIALIVFWLAGERRRTRGNRVVLGVLITVLSFVGLGVATGLINRVLATSEESARFVIYPRILEALPERLWTGHGLGAFQDTFRAHVPMAQAHAEWDMAHNSYLENIWEMGLPAAAVFYLVLVLIGWRLLSGVRHRRRGRHVPALALAAFLAAGFHALLDSSLQMPATAALFAWILGTGMAQSRSQQDHRV